MEEVEQALDSINTGKWLQMEGAVGRWANDFLVSEEIIVDTERTKKEGTVCFVDGIGRSQEQPYFKIDWNRVDEIEMNK